MKKLLMGGCLLAICSSAQAMPNVGSRAKDNQDPIFIKMHKKIMI